MASGSNLPVGSPGFWARSELELRARVPATGSYVYTGFLASLDGRISLDGRSGPPPAIRNDHDWQWFVGLMMQADVVLSTGRYVRETATGKGQPLLPRPGADDSAHLFEWREQRGLARRPAVAVLTASGDLDASVAADLSDRVLVVMGREPAPALRVELESAGVELVLTEGNASSRSPEGAVSGSELIAALASRNLRCVCSAAGPRVLSALAPFLDALFLTLAGRLVGGRGFATLLDGPELEAPPSFELASAWYDPDAPRDASQLFMEWVRRAGP